MKRIKKKLFQVRQVHGEAGRPAHDEGGLGAREARPGRGQGRRELGEGRGAAVGLQGRRLHEQRERGGRHGPTVPI